MDIYSKQFTLHVKDHLLVNHRKRKFSFSFISDIDEVSYYGRVDIKVSLTIYKDRKSGDTKRRYIITSILIHFLQKGITSPRFLLNFRDVDYNVNSTEYDIIYTKSIPERLAGHYLCSKLDLYDLPRLDLKDCKSPILLYLNVILNGEDFKKSENYEYNKKVLENFISMFGNLKI